nr:hypothetical protein [Kibdelosporangium sp. MJ126-NF4]
MVASYQRNHDYSPQGAAWKSSKPGHNHDHVLVVNDRVFDGVNALHQDTLM